MEHGYSRDAQEVTLVQVERDGERRWLYARIDDGALELVEVSQGSLTDEVFGSPEHRHRVRLAGDAVGALLDHLGCEEKDALRALKEHVADEELFLVDLMDELDGWGVPYGYLESVAGSHVSYRPPMRQGA